jgi:hypothetical protein
MERMSLSLQSCRCGYNGEGEHPCHRCISKGGEVRPGKRHFITYPTALAGMQMKLGAYETFACEPCLKEYRDYVERAAEKARDEVQAELREVKP